MTQTTVRIPTPLRSFTDGADEVDVSGSTVGQVLLALVERYDGLGARLLDDGGDLRPFVNLFLGSDDIRRLDGLETPVTDGAVLSIIPAVAGGVR